ncbi:MAG: hypothetical protein OXG91_05240 [bacterium]|nr:hypothetical protein [bacterium]
MERQFGGRVESGLLLVATAGVDLGDQLAEFEGDLLPAFLEPVEDLVYPR